MYASLISRIIILFYFQSIFLNAEAANCGVFNNCDRCVRNINCGWCIKPLNVSLAAGCIERDKIQYFCERKMIEMPALNQPIYIIKNENLSNRVQLKPQEIKITLIPGEEKEIHFQFRRSEDYPVDIYYLMDYSYSMSSTRGDLIKFGEILAQEMKKMTRDLQLGFGSFVDKPTQPFADSSRKRTCLVTNDYGEQWIEDCVKTYLFKNHMPLTTNVNLFQPMIKKTKMSANEDSPEGTLEALLQAVVCTKQINWRIRSFKFVVLATDDEFHIAGDGKLGGVVRPHDGGCYLNHLNDYTHALELDYPSVGMVAQKVKDNGIMVIFTVKEHIFYTYSNLSQHISGSFAAKLDAKKPKDIINHVIKRYRDLDISLRANATEILEVRFKQSCPGNRQVRGICKSVAPKDVINFSAIIKVPEYYDCSQTEQIVKIEPVQVTESLIVKVKIHCGCQCSKPNSENYIKKSSKCSSVGDYKCGRCECPADTGGVECECNASDKGSGAGRAAKCRTNNDCNQHGNCFCGKCQCEQNFSGDNCECNNNLAACVDECSGHGSCQCGQCVCHTGFDHDSSSNCNCDPETDSTCRCTPGLDHSVRNCNCTTDTEKCRENEFGQLCGGHGQCKCGKCECHYDEQTKKLYTGDYCNICTDCEIPCTDELSRCVDCIAYSGNTSCPKECLLKYPIISRTHNVEAMKSYNPSSQLCSALDDKQCTLHYVPYHEDKITKIFVLEEKSCPESNILIISLGVMGTTIFGGLLILILWRICTLFHDRREFEKFEMQRNQTKWGRGDNPLYKQALTHYNNPMFDENGY